MATARRFKAVLLDMDGVLFHGDRVLPGAARFLHAIAALPHCFVTNNPIRTPQQISDHFAALGLPRPRPERILTSALATAAWLSLEKPGFRYYPVGAPGLDEALRAVGSYDAEAADFVVVGEGPGLDFHTLTTGINLILKRGARLVSTNPDHNVDADRDGRHQVLPGGGALVAPFAVATGVEPVVVGKPHPLLYRMAVDRLALAAGDCVMVGDRPDTDIAGAQALDMATALVRSGRFGPGAGLPAGIRPDWDTDSLTELAEEWRSLGF